MVWPFSSSVQETLDPIEILSGEGAAPPNNIVLFKKGVNRTKKGDFIFDEQAAKDVMAAFSAGGLDSLPVDVAHLSLKSENPAAHKSKGWWVPSVTPEGDLIASNATWTKETLSEFENREWRFVSPAIKYDKKTRRISSVLNMALTNLPATIGQKPLVLSDSEEEQEPMKIFETLDAKDEAQALLAVSKIRDERDAAVKEVESLKREALITQLSQVEGKLKPNQIPFARTLSVAQLSEFSKTLEPAGERVEEKKGVASEQAETLSAEELHVIGLIGITKEQYLAEKARENKA